VPTTGLSGGVKVIFEIASRLAGAGFEVDVFSYAGAPKWHSLDLKLIPQKNLEDIPCSDYDFVLVSNPFMVPMILPVLGTARGVYFCQDYESFHHARGNRFEDYVFDDPTFREIYALPIPIIAVSTSIRQLIKDRIGRKCYYMPVGINKDCFQPIPIKKQSERKRVLMIGNYLTPHKGMPDGFQSLALLNERMPVELVLATQQERERSIFADLPYPVEIHHCPGEPDIRTIMSTCDVYCCTSWYEGLGLPGIEAFHCGLPVVSTRDYGVDEYGIDGVNILLANPNDPQDLAQKLYTLLSDEGMRAQFRTAGFETVANRYRWEYSLNAMIEALDDIAETYSAPDVDSDAMDELVRRLDREGSLTPIEVFRRFHEIAAEIDIICDRSALDGALSAGNALQLATLYDELKQYTSNPAAEYYKAFKALLDRTRMVRGLAGMPVAAAALRKLVERKQAEAPATPQNVREIKYQ